MEELPKEIIKYIDAEMPAAENNENAEEVTEEEEEEVEEEEVEEAEEEAEEEVDEPNPLPMQLKPLSLVLRLQAFQTIEDLIAGINEFTMTQLCCY